MRTPRTALVAAACWLVLAFLVWNVRFDYGVRVSAKQFLSARAACLRGDGPAVELGDAMRAGIRQAARDATALASPVGAVGAILLALATRRVRNAGDRLLP